uniref:EF-hand domain-containing protein n=1 Tax=Acrobeloides nanus TaxID=290746 RepID=A0A914C8K6_9BILA
MNTFIILISSMLVGFVISYPLEIQSPDFETPGETHEQTFDRTDADKNAFLTFDEFLHTDIVYENMKREEFNVLDTNHDGAVSRNEYLNHFQKEKENADGMRAEYFGKIYEEYDNNFDLKLDQDEVTKVLAERFLLKPRENFANIFKSFDANNDGGLDITEYVKFDAEMPFHELDPVTVAYQQPSIFKQEKLPLMKPFKKIE